MLQGVISGAAEIAARLEVKGAIGKALEDATALAAQVVKAQAQTNLSGPILDVKTGALRAGVLTSVKRSGLETTATVGTPIIYGAAHENGAQILNGFGKGIPIDVRPRYWLAHSLEQSRDKVFALYDRVLKNIVLRLSGGQVVLGEG
jgi:phage gpG-like protein